MTGELFAIVTSPGVIIILTALLGLGLGPTVRAGLYLAGLAASAFVLIGYQTGLAVSFVMLDAPFLTIELTPLRVDRLSFIFALIFHIAAALNVIYAWRIGDRVQDVAGLAYAGAAVGGALAGDLLTLFIFWELSALASAFLVFAPGTKESYAAGMRYLVVQILSGLLLLAGLALFAADGRGLAFEAMSLMGEDGALDIAALALFSPSASRRRFRSFITGCRIPIPRRRSPVLSCCPPSPPSWRSMRWRAAFPAKTR